MTGSPQGVGSPHSIDAVPAWSPRWWLAVREWVSLWRVVLSLPPQGPQPASGSAVLLIPGFLAGDWSLRPAARTLRRLGYRTYTAGIRANVGCTAATVSHVERRATELADRLGHPVALVGHSRGGTIARVVASRRPSIISHVVTLGSPLTHQFAAGRHILTVAESLARQHRRGLTGLLDDDCLRGDCARTIADELAAPLPGQVAWTSVYTRGDGVVQWRSCLAPGADHVRVPGSHNGLASNPTALAATARALGNPLTPTSPTA